MIEFQTLSMDVSDIAPMTDVGQDEYSKTNFDDMVEGFINSLVSPEEGGDKYGLVAPVIFLGSSNKILAIISYTKVPDKSSIHKPEIVLTPEV